MHLSRSQLRARRVCRINGRIMLYVLTPIIVIAPLLRPDAFRWWHIPAACALAVVNVYFSRWIISLGDDSVFRG